MGLIRRLDILEQLSRVHTRVASGRWLRHSGLVVEIAALVVSSLSLVLAGLRARSEQVKSNRSVVRGLVGLLRQLDSWRSSGRATNRELRRWIGRVLATADESERLRLLEVLPIPLRRAVSGQGPRLDHVWGGGPFPNETAQLLSVYDPENAVVLSEALSRRIDLVQELAETAKNAYASDGVDGLELVLEEAEGTVRLLIEATNMLRQFIRENVSIEAYHEADQSFEEQEWRP